MAPGLNLIRREDSKQTGAMHQGGPVAFLGPSGMIIWRADPSPAPIMVKTQQIYFGLILFSFACICTTPVRGAEAIADPRLGQSHDVDHPWMFDPHFADAEQWHHRATEVREQVLVAEGLWPLPQKTPLNPVIHGKVQREG